MRKGIEMQNKTIIRKATKKEIDLDWGCKMEINDAISGYSNCASWNKLADSLGFSFLEIDRNGMLVGSNQE